MTSIFPFCELCLIMKISWRKDSGKGVVDLSVLLNASVSFLDFSISGFVSYPLGDGQWTSRHCKSWQFNWHKPQTCQVSFARSQSRKNASLLADTTATNQQARFSPFMAAQILQAKTADSSIREHCSFCRLITLHDISCVCLGNVPCLLCRFRNSRVFSCGRRTLRSSPSSLAAPMLRGSLDCMSSCLLVGSELSPRFLVQYGGTRRDCISFLCRPVYSSQNTKHPLCIL